MFNAQPTGMVMPPERNSHGECGRLFCFSASADVSPLQVPQRVQWPVCNLKVVICSHLKRQSNDRQLGFKGVAVSIGSSPLGSLLQRRVLAFCSFTAWNPTVGCPLQDHSRSFSSWWISGSGAFEVRIWRVAFESENIKKRSHTQKSHPNLQTPEI